MARQSVTVIRGGRVLDFRAHAAPFADILIEGDTIADVGAPGTVAPEGASIIDARDKLLHPGLVNAHTHGHANLARAVGDCWTLELLLTASPWVYGGQGLEEKYLTTQIGAAEMVLKGCTACYDLTLELPFPTPEGVAVVASAYEEVGMRAVIAPMVADMTFFDAIPGLLEALPRPAAEAVKKLRAAPCKAILNGLEKAIGGWTANREWIRPAVAPTIPLHCSSEFMRACARLGREYGAGLHSHVAESKIQAVAGVERYGKTLVAYLDELGLLGPDFTVAHGVWLDEDDMRRLAERGASLAHNPGSNMRLGSGLTDVRGILEHGVNVGIGTDGATCSDNLNMYEAMRLASFASKVQGPDYDRWLTTEEVVAAATSGSAQALGFEKIGRIAPGYKADIVFLDLQAINWIAVHDPTNQLVHVEDGTSVDSVMIGGRMVVERRQSKTIDLARLRSRAEDARERLQAHNRSSKELFDSLQPVVGEFCRGLAQRPYHVNRYGAHAPPGHN